MATTLTQLHAPYFPSELRLRGTHYHRTGRVDLSDLTEERAVAVVSGTRDYEVVLEGYADPVDMDATCECPYFDDNGDCKHIWATLVAVEEVLTSLEVNPEVATGEAHTEPVQREPAKPARLPKRRPAAQPKPKPSVSPKGADWHERLEHVLPEEGGVQGQLEDTVIEYFLQLEQGTRSSNLPGMVVQVRSRKRKQSGELGALRSSSLPRFEVERLPGVDRTLLASCERHRLASFDYRRWSVSGRELHLVEPWPVPMDAMAMVLPLLATTGRTYRGPAPLGKAIAQNLRIDVEEPFRFEIAITSPRAESGAKAVVQVSGALRRGTEQLPLGLSARVGVHPYVMTQDRVVRLELYGAAKFALELASRGPIQVPQDEVPVLLERLGALQGARHFLTPALEHLPTGTPIGIVSILIPAEKGMPLGALLDFDYEGDVVSLGHDQPAVTVQGTLARRDFVAEERCVEQLAAAGLQRGSALRFHAPRTEFGAVVSALCAAGIRVLAEGKPIRGFVKGKGSVTSGIDWLEVGGEVEFTGYRAALPELLRRKRTPEGFLELGDGSFGMLPESWLSRVDQLRLLGGEHGEKTLRLVSSQALLLDAMLGARSDAEFSFDKQFLARRKRLMEFQSVAPAMEPAGFCGELRPYQRQGLGWLRFLHEFELGGCLADDMGLGKTVMVLAHLATIHARDERPSRPSLLVAPRSVLPNWLMEAQRFAPGLRVLDFGQADRWQAHGKQLGEHDLVITTYGLLRTDAVEFEKAKIRFCYVILDEAQVAKNAESLTSKAARLLRADHRLTLSGTPVENHLGELWSLFEFLNPGMLGRLPAFRSLFGAEVTSESLTRNREIVQRALRPVLLRRTKAQVLPDLPEKIEQTLWCELEPAQRRRYDELCAHYRDLLLTAPRELASKERFVVLEALLRLRQAACHEGLLDPSKRKESSAKLDALLPRLEELAEEDHKVLVFSQFTAFLDLVEPALTSRGIEFERLDGTTRDRATRVKRFQEDPRCKIFLISLKAGGFGLNLTAADYVFVLDPWWNPAAEMQAIDRTHRIGQKRTVNAYRLVCRGTVEERVLELQAKKKALCEAILGNERSLLQDMTREDLRVLLG